MSKGPEPLRSTVVGLHMGSGHARTMDQAEEFELIAVCDLNEELAQEVAG